MAFAVSEQIQTASKPYLNPFKQVCFFKLSAWTYILILSSIQYIYIPFSNITTQSLVFCCGTALEPDFLTIFFQDVLSTTVYLNIYSEAWWKPMLELPTAHYFLGVKVGAAHWAAHYEI